ncbi:MAG: hypothetical protein HOP04_14695 [Methylophilaceae bacterium]|nr:hypothetical protein [Methylophilaceae bacterium]
MMLPNGKSAFVDIAKIADYCLNDPHPEGRHKARVFQSVLGLNVSDALYLQSIIFKAAAENTAIKTETDQYGARYILDFELTINMRSAIIRTCWIIRTQEDFPRLTTCYLL